jgi:hypothetical protein
VPQQILVASGVPSLLPAPVGARARSASKQFPRVAPHERGLDPIDALERRAHQRDVARVGESPAYPADRRRPSTPRTILPRIDRGRGPSSPKPATLASSSAEFAIARQAGQIRLADRDDARCAPAADERAIVVASAACDPSTTTSSRARDRLRLARAGDAFASIGSCESRRPAVSTSVHRNAAEVDALGECVTRRAGNLGDDRAVPSPQRVEQARFPGVRAPTITTIRPSRTTRPAAPWPSSAVSRSRRRRARRRLRPG